MVRVDELIEGVRAALADRVAVDCQAYDANRDGRVTIDEIVRAVANALRGCPGTR